MDSLFSPEHFHLLPEVDSTNAEIKRRLQQEGELPRGYAVQALYQTSGRGQLGQSWLAENGKNLLLSFWLPAPNLKPRQSFLLNMSVCLALHDFLATFGRDFRIKWPNDLVRLGYKYAGVLIENQIQGPRLQGSIIGLGVNINQRQFPLPQAASLWQILGKEVPLTEARALLGHLLQERLAYLNKGQWIALKRAFLERLHGFSEEIAVREQEGAWQAGLVKDIHPGGELEFCFRNGQHKVYRFKQIEQAF